MLAHELRSACQIVSLAGLLFSVLMYFPWIISLILNWDGGGPFFWAATTSSMICLLVALASRGETPRVSARFGIIVVNLLWWICPLICSLPLMLGEKPLSSVDAIFEAVSGLTTTGSTIISDLDIRDRPILLWRAMIQWIGGLGILSLGLILLPFLRVGGMQLFRMESSDRAEKPLPRLIEISKTIILIYLILSLACASAYYIAGMGIFDAVVHAMTTVSTGGFSSHNDSLGYFNSLTILWIAIVFMIIGGLPFNFFIGIFFTRNIPKLDPQIFVFLGIIVFSTVVLCGLDFSLSTLSFSEFSNRAFNLVSIISTTGYASGDFMSYGMIGPVLFFVLIFIGGCAGSTSGGIKIYRFIIMTELIKSSLRELVYSKGVFLMHYGKQVVDEPIFRSAIIMIVSFFMSLAIVTILLGVMGLDFITALSGATTALANVGPGIGPVIGPTGNFSSLGDPEKIVLTVSMIVGRLEILIVMALFLPLLWKS